MGDKQVGTGREGGGNWERWGWELGENGMGTGGKGIGLDITTLVTQWEV